jgi:hypothetical protein
MTGDVKAGETGGVRWLIAALPVPAWTKNDRTGVVLKQTARMKAGQRYLTPLARTYRDMVALAVAMALPERPWFRPGGWHLDCFQYFTSQHDQDHFLSGIQDDLVKAGLVADDADCIGGPLVKEQPADRDVVFIFARERVKERPNGDEK